MRWVKHLAWLSMMLAVACGGEKSEGTASAVPTETQPPLATPVYSRTTAEPTPNSSPIPRTTVGPGGVQDASNRIFVDLTDGNDAGDGTRKGPLRSLGAALNRAAAIESPEVFVSKGQINGPVNLSSRVQVFGGFDASTWDRQDGQSTLITSSGYALVITGDGVLVDGFTLRTTGRVGVSSIAVLVQGANEVVLTNDTIIAVNGAGGSPGPDGGIGRPGSDGEKGEDAGECTATKAGGAGGSGSSSSGGKGGDGTPKSGIAGEQGSNGGGAGGPRGSSLQDGRPGENGARGVSDLEPGGGGRSFGILAASGYAPSAAEDGSGSTGDGKAGGGGGGGGGGGRSTSPCGGGGGGGGAGGIGSKAHGKGGQGGGASVGVLALNAEISVVRSEIETGDGGSGGRGGDGGEGGKGGNGGLGGARDVIAAAGGRGGDGGPGGDSAPGGGGGGGPSIGVLGDSRSELNVSSTRFTLGTGGVGGAGGASASANGEAADEGSDGRVDDVYRAPDPDQ